MQSEMFDSRCTTRMKLFDMMDELGKKKKEVAREKHRIAGASVTRRQCLVGNTSERRTNTWWRHKKTGPQLENLLREAGKGDNVG